LALLVVATNVATERGWRQVSPGGIGGIAFFEKARERGISEIGN
jgi:hypothetical protein